jgi:hypothetical protein
VTEDYSDLPLARLRWGQACERIAERYPRAARDGQLASILEGLGDALGVGPEATDPERAQARETDVWRTQLSPDLWMAVDASLCVVLEVTTPAGRVIRRVTVGRGLGEALELALGVVAGAAHGAAPGAAAGKLNRHQAVDWLIERSGWARGTAANIVRGLELGTREDPQHEMTYAAGYWAVPVNSEQSVR